MKKILSILLAVLTVFGLFGLFGFTTASALADPYWIQYSNAEERKIVFTLPNKTTTYSHVEDNCISVVDTYEDKWQIGIADPNLNKKKSESNGITTYTLTVKDGLENVGGSIYLVKCSYNDKAEGKWRLTPSRLLIFNYGVINNYVCIHDVEEYRLDSNKSKFHHSRSDASRYASEDSIICYFNDEEISSYMHGWTCGTPDFNEGTVELDEVERVARSGGLTVPMGVGKHTHTEGLMEPNSYDEIYARVIKESGQNDKLEISMHNSPYYFNKNAFISSKWQIDGATNNSGIVWVKPMPDGVGKTIIYARGEGTVYIGLANYSANENTEANKIDFTTLYILKVVVTKDKNGKCHIKSFNIYAAYTSNLKKFKTTKSVGEKTTIFQRDYNTEKKISQATLNNKLSEYNFGKSRTAWVHLVEHLEGSNP